jgi:Tol biopolymer transport system component
LFARSRLDRRPSGGYPKDELEILCVVPAALVVLGLLTVLALVGSQGAGAGAEAVDLIAFERSTDRDRHPSWSPNGRKLLFTRHIRVGIGDDVFVANADGSGLRRLTRDFYLSAGESLSWSPDGRRVVVTGSMGGANDEIVVMNADGSDQRNLTGTPGINEDFPTWSPTGTSIAFTSGSKYRRTRTIHTIRPDGRRHRNLGRGTQPSWRANGRSIVFIRTQRGDSDIYVMTATGRNATKLTNSGDGTQNVSPAWSPH